MLVTREMPKTLCADLVQCSLMIVLEVTGFLFSCALDEEQRAMLRERSKKQIIFEAETFCAVLAYLVWSDHLNLRNGFLYVDNEGTKYCLMKGASDNEMVDAICAVFAELEMWMQANCWLARVALFQILPTNLPEEIQRIYLTVAFQMILLWLSKSLCN